MVEFSPMTQALMMNQRRYLLGERPSLVENLQAVQENQAINQLRKAQSDRYDAITREEKRKNDILSRLDPNDPKTIPVLISAGLFDEAARIQQIRQSQSQMATAEREDLQKILAEQEVRSLLSGDESPAPSEDLPDLTTPSSPAIEERIASKDVIGSLQDEKRLIEKEIQRLEMSPVAGDKSVQSRIKGLQNQLGRTDKSLSQNLAAQDARYQAQNTVQAVNDLLSHEGFSDAVGAKFLEREYLFGLKDEPTQGSKAAGFETRLGQIKNKTFLEARQMLKGGGAITDFEGSKAESAFNRMSTTTSEKEFKAAADDFLKYTKQGARKILESNGMSTYLEGDKVAVNKETGERIFWDGNEWKPM